MDKKYNSNIIPYAKQLRKNMTKEEKRLWYDFLKNYPVKFSRQKVLGKYIADFYSAKANVVIELDGSQHYEEKNAQNDEKRTEYLNDFGISVLRISNRDISLNFEGVCDFIDVEVKKRVEGK